MSRLRAETTLVRTDAAPAAVLNSAAASFSTTTKGAEATTRRESSPPRRAERCGECAEKERRLAAVSRDLERVTRELDRANADRDAARKEAAEARETGEALAREETRRRQELVVEVEAWRGRLTKVERERDAAQFQLGEVERRARGEREDEAALRHDLAQRVAELERRAAYAELARTRAEAEASAARHQMELWKSVAREAEDEAAALRGQVHSLRDDRSIRAHQSQLLQQERDKPSYLQLMPPQAVVSSANGVGNGSGVRHSGSTAVSNGGGAATTSIAFAEELAQRQAQLLAQQQQQQSRAGPNVTNAYEVGSMLGGGPRTANMQKGSPQRLARASAPPFGMDAPLAGSVGGPPGGGQLAAIQAEMDAVEDEMDRLGPLNGGGTVQARLQREALRRRLDDLSRQAASVRQGNR